MPAGANNNRKPDSYLHDQLPLTINHKRHELATQDQSQVTQTFWSDGNHVAASPALSATGSAAQEALSLERSSSSTTMPHPSSDEIRHPARLEIHSSQSSEVSDVDVSMSAQDDSEGQPPYGRSTYNNPNITAIASQDAAGMAGQKCLRGTPNQDDLKALIKRCINSPENTDPDFLAIDLADDLLSFYEARAQPPGPPVQRPYMPTSIDLQKIILPILKDKRLSDDISTSEDKLTLQTIKCMTILKAVDNWYGSKGWAQPFPLPTLNLGYDSGIIMSQSSPFSQPPSTPNNRDAEAVPREKRRRDSITSGTPPAKRTHLDLVGYQTSPRLLQDSPLASPQQSQSISTAERVRCAVKDGCGGKRANAASWMLHIKCTYYPLYIYICPFCLDKFTRKDRICGPSGHFYTHHSNSYDDVAVRRHLEENLLITVKNVDTFCNICPACQEDVPLETIDDFMNHFKQHVKGEINTYPPRDRCREGTNHDWRNSKCIPEKYRQRNEEKISKQSCHPTGFGSSQNKDDDDNSDDEDPSGSPPQGGNSSHGPSEQSGSGVGAGGAGIGFTHTSDHGSYKTPYPSQTFTTPLAHFSGNLDSNLRVCSQKTNPRIATPGINLIKKCFKSIRKLGRGGFGSVDEVLCKPTNMLYARKIINLGRTAGKVTAEVEILKQLRHQHIINLAAYCTTSDQLWLFTTPVADGNLATYLYSDASSAFALPSRELLKSWEGDLASALKYLHGRGIYHGDIKPQNILVSSDMKIYMADFGSARAKYAEPSHGTKAKLASALTPKYSAPEVTYYKSMGYTWETGAAADIFSLGCVWAEMDTIYTGLSIQAFENFRSGGSAYNPFQANLPRTYLWLDFLWVLQQLVLQTSKCWSRDPGSLQIIRKMLSFDPQQRPGAHELTNFLDCTCIVNIHDQRQLEFLSERPLLAPRGEKYTFYGTNDLPVAEHTKTRFWIKRSNASNKRAEGFSPTGCIDILHSWDTGTPVNQLSPWIENSLATSTAPSFFSSQTNGCELLSHFSGTFRVGDGDCKDSVETLLGRDYLQKQYRIALHDAFSQRDTRTTHAKGLTKSQYLQKQLSIPKCLDLPASPLSLTLSDYLRKTSPPSSAEDTLKLWTSGCSMLHVVAHANADYMKNGGTLSVFNFDLKPENILILPSDTKSPYVWKIGGFGISSRSIGKNISRKDGSDLQKPRTYEAPEAIRPEEVSNLSRATQGSDMRFLGSILLEVLDWVALGNIKLSHSKQQSQSKSAPQGTNFNHEHDEYESHLGKRARNAKQDLLNALAKEPDPLTKSVAESVIAPMLEPPDNQPSWKWICEKARTILDDARDTLSGYKKTVTKIVSPLRSFLRSKIRSTCVSSTIATDGNSSEHIEISDFEKNPDGFGVGNYIYHPYVDVEPNIFTSDTEGYSYCLERFFRDKSDCRYLFPARGCDASKELDRIYVGDTIERFERNFVNIV